ncbi:MAG: hypothetical protein CL927_17410 [Deltaproteobacteria bacterium]|nr:hypothetical protein [Deltaproteobacteria bacterium]HCH62955.1 hypothetical protein [Deltaproteobacteria bacterium]
MARSGGRRRRSDSTSLNWLFALVGTFGLASFGYGLYLQLGHTESPSSESPIAAASSTAPSAPPPPPDGAPDAVRPGTVDLTRPAPADTTAPATENIQCPGCDIVLITVCSLRKDFVSLYGEHPGLTPHIDRIANGGIHFDRAYSASNFTLAGLTAVLTGRFGSTTGVLGWDKGLTAGVPTLPEILGYYGYITAGFTVDAPSGFRPDYGLDRGFQHMRVIPPPRETPDGRFKGGDSTPRGASADPVVAWIGEQSTDHPMFVMFHSRTAHFPFVNEPDTAGADPTGVWQGLWDAGRVSLNAGSGQAMPGMAGGTNQEGVVKIVGEDPLQTIVRAGGTAAVDSWRDRYAESVQRMDLDIKAVWTALEARGNLDRTIVVLVADHGESLNDHGELLHGDAYWDNVVNVPLVMRVPGIEGRDDAQPQLVSHVDLLPTLLDLVGAVKPVDIDGRSMVPFLRGEADTIRDMALIEGGVARHDTSQLKGAVITLPYTLVRQDRGCGGSPNLDPARAPGEPATCLYDLSTDPGQTTNIARQNMALVDALMQRWKRFREARAQEGAQLELDPAFVAELRANGYNFE